MKPYYQDDHCTIYNCDCREILPELPKVDLVLTDPPYGINFQSSRRIECERHDKIVGDDEFPMWIFNLKFEIALMVWCRWDNLYQIPKPKSFIVWDKMIHGLGDLKHEFGRQWEGCAFYPGEKHEFINRPVDVIRCQRITPGDMVHPAEKPTGAIKPLLVPHRGRILDPFMGSGTTLRAAKDLNRKAIGIEIEEKYCEIAVRRLEQEVLPL